MMSRPSKSVGRMASLGWVSPEEDVVEAGLVGIFGDSEAAGGVALGVGIDDQDRMSLAAREAARLMAVVVFPTPPFWLAIAKTLLKRSD